MNKRIQRLTEGTVGDQANLLAEFDANVALWQHDDMLRQQRNGIFLTVNAVLLGFLGAAAGLSAPRVYIGAVTIVFSVFAMLICRVWHFVQVRNAEYVRFRRFQLRSIESRLPPMTTFTNTYQAFYEHEQVSFPGMTSVFEIHDRCRHRSTLVEGNLPQLLGFFWLLIGLAGSAVVVYILTRSA